MTSIAKAIADDYQVQQSIAWGRLRFITSEISLMLNLLMAGPTLRPGVATPELIALLLGYLQEVAVLRSSGQLEASDGLLVASESEAWQGYRSVLEQLRRVMPTMEQQLRNDRTRLAHDQEQLSRADAWTSTAKLTR